MSDKFSLGTVCFDHDGFFSYEELASIVRKQYPYIKGVVIVNIYEFADREDFLKYKGESKPMDLLDYVHQIRTDAVSSFNWTYDQTSFITAESASSYHEKNVPVSEALKDLVFKRLG